MSRNARSLALLCCTLLGFGSLAYAQGRPGGGMPGGMGGAGNRPGFPDRAPGFPGNHSSGNPRNEPPPGAAPEGKGPTESTMSGGLQLGPAGRWWDDRSFAKNLGIDSRQQQRMDDVFSANRGTLLKLYKNLQHEEKELAKTIRAKDLDESQIFAQIDRVTQARAELEKANVHYSLQIRKEMSPEQNARLDEHRPTPPAQP